jgi:hypothetical protein
MNRVENKRALEHTSWPLIKCKWHKMDHKIIKMELTKSRLPYRIWFWTQSCEALTMAKLLY